MHQNALAQEFVKNEIRAEQLYAEYVRNHLDLYKGPPPATVLPLKVRGRAQLRVVK